MLKIIIKDHLERYATFFVHFIIMSYYFMIKHAKLVYLSFVMHLDNLRSQTSHLYLICRVKVKKVRQHLDDNIMKEERDK